MKKLFAKLKHEHKGDDNPAKEQAPAKADGKPLSEGATVDAGRVKEIAAMVGPVYYVRALPQRTCSRSLSERRFIFLVRLLPCLALPSTIVARGIIS